MQNSRERESNNMAMEDDNLGMEKLVNFRDLGGRKTKNGKTIKTKRLLRSGELVGLSENDKETLLSTYNLKMVFDFRDDGEVALNPDEILEGVVYTHIDIMEDVELGTTSKQNMFKMVDLKQADEQMKAIYRAVVISKSARSGYRQFIQAVAALKEGSALFHCFAGKDRTGIGAMILLELLGVDEAGIMEDFMKTNELRKLANEELLDGMRETGMEEEKIQVLHTFLNVKEEYLKAAYDAIEGEYGSFKGYVEKGLELDGDVVDRLRRNYLK